MTCDDLAAQSKKVVVNNNRDDEDLIAMEKREGARTPAPAWLGTCRARAHRGREANHEDEGTPRGVQVPGIDCSAKA